MYAATLVRRRLSLLIQVPQDGITKSAYRSSYTSNWKGGVFSSFFIASSADIENRGLSPQRPGPLMAILPKASRLSFNRTLCSRCISRPSRIQRTSGSTSGPPSCISPTLNRGPGWQARPCCTLTRSQSRPIIKIFQNHYILRGWSHRS